MSFYYAKFDIGLSALETYVVLLHFWRHRLGSMSFYHGKVDTGEESTSFYHGKVDIGAPIVDDCHQLWRKTTIWLETPHRKPPRPMVGLDVLQAWGRN